MQTIRGVIILTLKELQIDNVRYWWLGWFEYQIQNYFH